VDELPDRAEVLIVDSYLGDNSIDWDALLRKLSAGIMAGQQTDTKAPLNQGLMAAGLGMLANANKGFAGGVGAGGLLGLEAYNTERQRQMKDPMQQMQMASGLLGLRQNLQSQATMRNIQQAMGGGQQEPAPESAPDFVGPPASAAPNYTPPPVAQGGLYQALSAALMDPKLGPMAKAAMEARGWMPQNLRPGSSLVMPDARGNFTAAYTAPDLGQGQRLGPNGAELIPGYQQNIAAVAGAKTGAEEAERARYATVQTEQGGRPVMTTAAKFAASQEGAGQPQAAPPADLIKAMDELKKRGVATRWTPENGLVMGDAALVPPTPSLPLGVGRTEAEKAAAMTPVKAAEAAALQQAKMPGEITEQSFKDLAASDAKKFGDQRDKAEQAMKGNVDIANIRRVASEPNAALGGMFAAGAQGALNFLNSAGLDVLPEKFKNTQEAEIYLNGLSLKQVKAMVGSQNISDRDVIAVKAMLPQIVTNPQARLRVLDTLEKANNYDIQLFNAMDQHVGEKGNLRGFKYDFKPAGQTPTQDKPPMTGARQAPDGNWYIKNGNQYLKVVP
jgi:hypothetical protein